MLATWGREQRWSPRNTVLPEKFTYSRERVDERVKLDAEGVVPYESAPNHERRNILHTKAIFLQQRPHAMTTFVRMVEKYRLSLPENAHDIP